MNRSITVSAAGAAAAFLVATAISAPDVTAATTTGDVAQAAARPMENLGRGVVAVRSSNTNVLVSWRLLGLDPAGIGFNVYRSTGGGAEARLNSAVLTGGTNFVDSTANLAQANTYRVRPVVGGAEQAPSGAFTLTANHATEPVVRVPLRAGGPVSQPAQRVVPGQLQLGHRAWCRGPAVDLQRPGGPAVGGRLTDRLSPSGRQPGVEQPSS